MLIKALIAKLSNKELQTCFGELKEWMDTGILIKDGLVRKIHQECESQLQTELDLRVIESKILYEISERFSQFKFDK